MLLTVKSRPILATALPVLLTGVFTCADLPFASLANSLQAQQQPANEIRWFEELAPAIQYASVNNLPLMLHFYGDNSPPCRLLERKAFKNPELIGTMNAQIVAVRINAEKNKELRTRYNITRWPTDVFVTNSGKELYRSVSPQDPVVYGRMIDRMALRNRDWTIEQNVAAQTAERRLNNQTSAQSARFGQNGQNGQNGPAPSFPSADRESVAVQPAANQGELPRITAGSGIAAGNKMMASSGAPSPVGQTVSNPFMAAAPAVSPPDQAISATSSPALGMSTGMSTGMSAGAASTGVPVHMASSPTSARSASNVAAVDPHDIASTPSNLPAATPQSETSVGLEGYCPVTLFMAVKGEIDQANCWTQGQPKFAVKHRGRIYMCASEDMRQRFLQSPDLYSPCLSGFDLIHYIKTQELIDGKCEFGCFQGDTGRIFLFANQENSNEFRQKEAFYSRLVNANQTERVATQPDAVQVR